MALFARYAGFSDAAEVFGGADDLDAELDAILSEDGGGDAAEVTLSSGATLSLTRTAPPKPKKKKRFNCDAARAAAKDLTTQMWATNLFTENEERRELERAANRVKKKMRAHGCPKIPL